MYRRKLLWKDQENESKIELMALKRSRDIWQVFTGESFGYIAASLCSFLVDCSRIGCQECSREPFCLSMEKQERQHKKSSYVSIRKKQGNQFCKFLRGC